LGVLGKDSAWARHLARARQRNESLLDFRPTVEPPDAVRAMVYYRDGLELFDRAMPGCISPDPACPCETHQDLRTAYDDFSHALRNDPASRAWAGYWRALTALRLGRRDQAGALLDGLRRNGVERSLEVRLSMQRVQGPLRNDFERLVRHTASTERP
jgi:hypothetical protein